MRFGFTMAIVLAVLATVYRAAQPSLPGDMLYPVKRSAERIQLLVTREQAQQAALHLDFAERRIDEAIRLSKSGRPFDDSLLESQELEHTAAWEAISRLEDVDEEAHSALTTRYHDEIRARLEQVDAMLAEESDSVTQLNLRKVRGSLAQTEQPAQLCSATFTIGSVRRGDVITQDGVTHIRGNVVGGIFTEGFLTGQSFTGRQDVTIDRGAMTAVLQGSITVESPAGELTLQYSGQTDQSIVVNRQAEGEFIAVNGTGQYTNWQWQGRMIAHLDTLNPVQFTVNAIGPCSSKR
jgi:hypothetical protein